MKRILIYQRTITERTKYRDFRYKAITEYTIIYDNKIYKNHYTDINNSKLRVKFDLVLDTRKKADVQAYYGKLTNTFVDKEIRNILLKLNLI